MIFNEQDVFVFTVWDAEKGRDRPAGDLNSYEIAWYGPWSEEADEVAKAENGFVVLCNSDPPVIFANYSPILTRDLESQMTEDHTEVEPDGGYVTWDGETHHVSLFGTDEGDYPEYEQAMDALLPACKELLAHPVYRNAAIEIFFAVNTDQEFFLIPLGKVR